MTVVVHPEQPSLPLRPQYVQTARVFKKVALNARTMENKNNQVFFFCFFLNEQL